MPAVRSLSNNQLDLFRLLVEAGAHLCAPSRRYLLSAKNLPAEVKQNSAFCEWLHRELTNAPSLQRLCAIAVRNRLSLVNGGRSVWDSAARLPIPPAVQALLRFEDNLPSHVT